MSKKKAALKARKRQEKKLQLREGREQAIRDSKEREHKQATEDRERNRLIRQEKEAQVQSAFNHKHTKLIRSDSNRLIATLRNLIKADDGVARQFLLEEVEAANLGNEAARYFAQESGFAPEEYQGAMENSVSTVDGPGGPQQYLLREMARLMEKRGMSHAVAVRVTVVDSLMQFYRAGRYAIQDNGQALLQAMFTEYFRYCEQPQSGIKPLINLILESEKHLDDQVGEIKAYYDFVKIMARCPEHIYSSYLPRGLNISSDLGLVSVVSIKQWLSAVRYLSSTGISQDDLYRAIECGRQVGNPDSCQCVINTAPAICNLMSFIYLQTHLRYDLSDFTERMWDTSEVTGAMTGNAGQMAELQSWLFTLARLRGH